MMMTEPKVAITGMGVVSAFGIGAERFWKDLAAGKSAARMIDFFDASQLPVRFAAPVMVTAEETEDYIENKKATKTMCRAARLVMVAAAEATKQAGYPGPDLDPYRAGTSLGVGGLGLFDLDYTKKSLRVVTDSIEQAGGRLDLGTVWANMLRNIHPLTPLQALPNITTAHVAVAYDARGHCQTITTACTSSTQALGEAMRLIESGVCDVVLAGGTDTMVNPNALVSFMGMGVLSQNNDEFATASRPFDRTRDGFMVGEGAAVFVLESLRRARSRGARVLATLSGYASTNDAFRMTDEPPDARGSVAAMRNALASARVAPESVDYINAHGTGTQMNDRTETLAIKTVFGDHARKLAVSSTKSAMGHLVAAAGAIELAACVLAIGHQTIPPTINYSVPDPDCDLDYVPNVARPARLDTVMSNSFGFGGQNACLLVHRDTGGN